MTVRVLFFSLLRDVTGRDEMEFDIAKGETVATLLERLADAFPGLRDWEGKTLVAVDQEYAERDAVLQGGEEIAVMPPVQGG